MNTIINLQVSYIAGLSILYLLKDSAPCCQVVFFHAIPCIYNSFSVGDKTKYSQSKSLLGTQLMRNKALFQFYVMLKELSLAPTLQPKNKNWVQRIWKKLS
jgi:hypothetical protein